MGVRLIVSDDHAGLKAARRAVLQAVLGSAASSICSKTPALLSPGKKPKRPSPLKEGLHNLLRVRIAALRGVGFGRFASHRLRRCEPSPKLRFRSLA